MSNWSRIQELLEKQRIERERAEQERQQREADVASFKERQAQREAQLRAAGAAVADPLAASRANLTAAGAMPQDDAVDIVARQSLFGSGDAGLIEQTARNALANLSQRTGSYLGGIGEAASELGNFNPVGAAFDRLIPEAAARRNALQREIFGGLRERQQRAAETLQAPQEGLFDAGLSPMRRLLLAASKTAAALPASTIDMAAAIGTAGVAPGLAFGSDEYLERRAEGDSRLKAAAVALPLGVASAWLERTGAEAIVAPAKTAGKRAIEKLIAAHKEGLTELGQDAVQMVSRSLLATERDLERNPDYARRASEFFSLDTVRQLGESYAIGAGVGGALKSFEGKPRAEAPALTTVQRAERLSKAVSGGDVALDAETAWRRAVSARASREALIKGGADPSDLAELDQDIAALEKQAGQFAVRQLQELDLPEPPASKPPTWGEYADLREALTRKAPGYREADPSPIPASTDPVAELERWAAPLRPRSPLQRLRAIASVSGIPESQWRRPKPPADPVAALGKMSKGMGPQTPLQRLRAASSTVGVDVDKLGRSPVADVAATADVASAGGSAPATTGPLIYGLEGSVAMPDDPNDRLRYRWVLGEAEDLIASHDPHGNPNPTFPALAQTRNRGDSVLVAQVARIAKDPKFEWLNSAPHANQGSPIADKSRTLLSATGRTNGLKLGYRQGTAGAYRADLEKSLESYGFPAGAAAGLKGPAIWREVIGDYDGQQFAELARRLNADPQAAQDVTEIARGDAMLIDDVLLSTLRDSDLEDPANRSFIGGFIRKVIPPNELQRYVDSAAQVPSSQLYDRAATAILAKAYPDSELLRRMSKDSEPLSRRFTRGLLAVAPRVAQYRAQEAAGLRAPGLDWYSPVLQVAARFDMWANDGRPGTVGEKARMWVGQLPLEPESPQQQAERELISIMLDDPDLQDGRKIKALGNVLLSMADRVDAINPPLTAQASMMGGPQQAQGFDPLTVVALFKLAQEDYRAAVISGSTKQQAMFSAAGDSGRVVTAYGGDVLEWKASTWALDGDVEVRLSGRGGVAFKVEGDWLHFTNANDAPPHLRKSAAKVLRAIEASGGNLRQGVAAQGVEEANVAQLGQAVSQLRQSLVKRGSSPNTATSIATLFARRAQVWSEQHARPAFEMFSAHPVVLGGEVPVASAMVPALERVIAATAAKAALRGRDLGVAFAPKSANGTIGVEILGEQRDNTALHEMTHVWWMTLSSSERDAFERWVTLDQGLEASGEIERKRAGAEEFVAVVERAIASGAAPAAMSASQQVLLGDAFGHLRHVAAHWHYDGLTGSYRPGDPLKAANRGRMANQAAAMLWGLETLRNSPEPYWSPRPPDASRAVVSAIDAGDWMNARAALQALPIETGGPLLAMVDYAEQAGSWPLEHQLDDAIAQGVVPEDAEAANMMLRQARARMASDRTRGRDFDVPLFSQPVNYQIAELQEGADANPATKAALSPPQKLPLWQRALAGMRARGYLPEQAFQAWKQATWRITGEVIRAEKAAGIWSRELERVAKSNGLRETTARRAMMLALETGTVSEVTAFGDQGLYRATMALRDHIDSLTDRMLATPGMIDPVLRETLENNKGKYLHRTYRYHTDPQWREGVEKSREWARAVEWWHDNRLFPGEDVVEQGRDAQGGRADAAEIKRAENHLRAWLINGGLDSFGAATGRKGADRTALWKRDNVPQQLRAVLGEERSPELAYVASVTSMVDALSKYEVFSLFARSFNGTVVSSEPTSTLNVRIDRATLRPLSGQPDTVEYVARVPQIRDRVRLVDPGTSSARSGGTFVVVGRAKGADSAPHHLGGLEGDMLTVVDTSSKEQWSLPAQAFRTEDGAVAIVGGKAMQRIVQEGSPAYYTTPEIAAWLEGDSPGTGKMAAALQSYLAINSAIKGGKVVLSPSTQIRNFLSNSMIAASSGLLTPSGFVRLLSGEHNADTWAAFIGRDPSKISEWVVKAAKYGALSAGATAADLESWRQNLEAVSRVEKQAQSVLRKGAGKLGSAMKVAEGIYQAGDSWWKLWAFREWAGRLAAAHGRSEPSEADYVDAGRRVNETFPSVENVASGVDFVRQLPLVGSYPSFFYLSTRSLFQTAKQAAADMRSDVPGIRRMGAQSALGLTAAMTLPTVLPLLLRTLARASDEDEEFAQRLETSWTEAGDLQKIGGEFRRNNELVMYGRDGYKIQFQDLSWLDPFNAVRKPALILMRKALEGRASEGDWIEAMQQALDAAVGPYLDMDMAFQTAVSVLANKRLGRSSGADVYNREESRTRRAVAVLTYVSRQLAPGGTNSLHDFWLAYTGEPQGMSGRVVKLSDALLGAVGIRTSTTDLETHLALKAFEMRDREQDARAIYTRGRLSASETENLGSLVRANEAYRKVWDDLQVQVSAARRLGISDQMIYQALTRARVPPRRVLGEMVFDDELKEQIAALRAIGMDDKQILGHLKDTGGARAPMTQKFAMRVLLNQWEPLNFEIK